jgi:hypothetical protein
VALQGGGEFGRPPGPGWPAPRACPPPCPRSGRSRASGRGCRTGRRARDSGRPARHVGVVAQHHAGELLLEDAHLGLGVDRRPRQPRGCGSRRFGWSPRGRWIRRRCGAAAASPGARRGGRLAAAQHRAPAFAAHQVRQEHLRTVALGDLERVHVAVAGHAVDIEQELGGFADARHGGGIVAAAREREVGHGVQLEQEGTGHLEEVRQHLVGGPLLHEGGQAVEHVERLLPLRRDEVVDRAAEYIEPRRGVHLDHLHPLAGRDHRSMRGEPHVEDAAGVLHRLVDVGHDEEPVVVEAVHLPDHVVAPPRRTRAGR